MLGHTVRCLTKDERTNLEVCLPRINLRPGQDHILTILSPKEHDSEGQGWGPTRSVHILRNRLKV